MMSIMPALAAAPHSSPARPPGTSIKIKNDGDDRGGGAARRLEERDDARSIAASNPAAATSVPIASLQRGEERPAAAGWESASPGDRRARSPLMRAVAAPTTSALRHSPPATPASGSGEALGEPRQSTKPAAIAANASPA